MSQTGGQGTVLGFECSWAQGSLKPRHPPSSVSVLATIKQMWGHHQLLSFFSKNTHIPMLRNELGALDLEGTDTPPLKHCFMEPMLQKATGVQTHPHAHYFSLDTST